jgi:vancomycin resistance protein YoaR
MCSIVFFYVFLSLGCQRQASSGTGDLNQDGAFLDVMDTLEPIQATSEGSEISSSMVRKDAKITIKADAILGEFRTNFSRSNKSRKQNIRTAASKINQTIVYPGEEFSICDLLVPFTEENGYLPAGTILKGKVIKSYGGGVCQVATTLYNAVLKAELAVIERHPHSMTVSYIEVGRDAAISENAMDFRFVNTLDTPIMVEAITTDWDELIFRIRGIKKKEVKQRSVLFETVILEEIQAGEPVIEYDETQPKDYIKVTQSAHNGYKAELYRIIIEDGVEVERKRINYSEYESSPQYMIVGSKPEQTKNSNNQE